MLGQLTPGTQVAGYEIERPLGRGGMGEVYLARKQGERRTVALKLLSSGLAADGRFQERFERESHMATSLEHPHIVPVYAIGEIEGVRFIAMRYIDGPTLRDLVDRESPLDVRRVASILGQIASALDDAHEIGLVHRDIKPANILIARSGASEYREHAYLTDFGVSKYTGSDSGFTGTGQFVGTSLYGSPEQIRGEPIDGRADVYAFGCVLFECLVGRPPFERDNEAALLWAQMFEQPPAVSARRADLPPAALDEVVAKAMAKPRADRYDTCGAVVIALREAINALDGAAASAALVAAAAASSPVLEDIEPPPAPETVLKPVPPVDEPEPIEDVEPEPESVAGPAESVAEPALVEPAVEASEGGGIEAPAPVAASMDEVAEAPASDPDSVAPKTVVSAAAPLVASVDSPAARPDPPSPPPTPETIVLPTTADTEVGVAVTYAPPRGAAPRSTADLTVIEDRVPTTPGTERPRRATPLLLVVAVLVALVLVGGVVYWLARDDGGAATTTPSATARPSVTGTLRAGETLRANPGTWMGDPTEFGYAWRRCNAQGAKCKAIPGADSRVLALTGRDVGSRLRIAVTASNDDGSRTTVSNATRGIQVALVRPASVTSPAVSGTTEEGSTLRVRPANWKGTKPLSRSYVWLRCHEDGSDCMPIPGARGATYTLNQADVDHTIRVEERVRNKAGRAVATSRPTTMVTALVSQQPPPPPPTSPPPPTETTETTECPPVCPTG